MRTKTYRYRTTDGCKVKDVEFEVFDEPDTMGPDKDGDIYYIVPDQATKGWTNFTYRDKTEKHEIVEWWKHGTAPESFTRDGIEYFMVFGVPVAGTAHRIGASSLLDKCDDSFQDLVNHAIKKSPKSRNPGMLQ